MRRIASIAAASILMLVAKIAGAPPLSAATLVLEMPAPASVIGGRQESPGSYGLPTGPYGDGKVPVQQAEGALDQRAFRLESPGLTTLQLLQPLRAQLGAAGYATIYECDTTACGGFDFRYQMDVLPEPQMHVDLGDFRYLAAQRTGVAGTDYVGVLVSRSADQGFVQITSVNAAGEMPPAPVAEAAPVAPEGGDVAVAQGQGGPGAQMAPALPAADAPAAEAGAADPAEAGLGDRLEQKGTVALDDLIFASGKAALEDKDYDSLAALAAWLKANPQRRVVLVGHTDASGSLAANIALSKLRAASVRAWLVSHYGAAAAQVDAQGAGFLAPRDTNLTEAGRMRNRRVEAMLASTE